MRCRSPRPTQQLRAVSEHFGRADRQQLGRCRAVAGQEPMCGLGSRVPRRTGVDDHYLAARSGQNQRCAETCCAPADHHYVVKHGSPLYQLAPQGSVAIGGTLLNVPNC